MNTNDYLMHHGIKGQKWGIRRFQNPDGTRTDAGKKRERAASIDKEKLFAQTIKGGKDKPNISPAEKMAKEAGNIATNAGTISKTVQKAKVIKEGRESKTLSEKELRDRINRMNLEKQYETLKEEDYNRGHITADDILNTVGSVVQIGGSVASMIAIAMVLKK